MQNTVITIHGLQMRRSTFVVKKLAFGYSAVSRYTWDIRYTWVQSLQPTQWASNPWWCSKPGRVSSHLRDGQRGKSQILFSKWLLRSLPKGGIPDHFLRFCFEMGLVFLAPALECRADSPWPWPARPLCFVRAPVGLAPVTIPALSAEGSIQGRPETHPHPISSTFWAQACVNQSSWFSSRSTAEAQRKGGCHLLSVC